MKEHGLPDETEATIKAKLSRGTFAARFLLLFLQQWAWTGFS
jgi:hypothetical protein